MGPQANSGRVSRPLSRGGVYLFGVRLSALPNLLSLVRIPLAAVPWFDPASLPLLFGTMVAAAVSDWLDGWTARRLARGGPVSGTGAWLDPLCDKVFVASALALVVVSARPPAWALPVVLARELSQAPLVLWYRLRRAQGRAPRFDFRAGPLGKLTTVVQFVAVGALALRVAWAHVPVVASGALGLLATVSYLRRGLRATASGA